MAGLAAPAFSLTPPEPAEAEALYAIHRQAMGGYIEATWGPWDDPLQQSFFAARLESGLLRVVRVSGEPVGLLEVDHRSSAIYIQNIELAPGSQGLGLGTAIIGEILAGAASRGIPVELQVLKVNPAIRLYRRLGFAVTGDTGTHWQMRCGPA